MFRSRPAPRLAALLSFLLIAWAQMFGLPMGYLCLCSGEAMVAKMDHCHGPHGAGCSQQTEENSKHSPGGCDDAEKHPVASSQPETLLTLSVAAPLAVITLIAVLPDYPQTRELVGAGRRAWERWEDSRPPPSSIEGSRTVVLLI